MKNIILLCVIWLCGGLLSALLKNLKVNDRIYIWSAFCGWLFYLFNNILEGSEYMPRGRKKKKEEVFDAEELIGTFMKGDRLTDDERYKKTVDNIYRKLKPIWLQECKDAMWLLQDDYVKTVADIIYLDDQMGGNLDPSTLSTDKQNLLGWKQVQSVIEKYRAMDYSLVDQDGIKAILSSIIKNKNARDADRLKAIEMYTGMYSGEGIEGVTFVNDLYKGKFEPDSSDEEDEESDE